MGEHQHWECQMEPLSQISLKKERARKSRLRQITLKRLKS
jgi:hypothetical protein